MERHIVSAYDRELGEIRTKLLELGGLVEVQFDKAIEALVERKPALAGEVIAGDEDVNALDRAIGEAVVLIVSRRQPVANDLRTIFAAGQMAQSMERIGDLAANIAKRSLALNRYASLAPALNVAQFARSVRRILTMALEAFADDNLDLALEVWRGDAAVDRHHSDLFRETLTAMQADEGNVVAGAHMLFVLKNLERIGDYATAIAEACHFSATGRYPGGERPKADSTSQWTPD